MRRAVILTLALILVAPPALAQQNQVPGDTNAGGDSRSQTSAQAALSGANTSDATTTGASGPKKKSSGPPGSLALPPLPSEDLCKGYEGDVRKACLSTTMKSGAAP